MPSIKNFKNTQPTNIKESSLSLWGMLDEFKNIVPTIDNLENQKKEVLKPTKDDSSIIQQSEKRYSNGTQTVLQTVLKEDSNGTQTVLKRYSKRYSKEYSNGTQTVLKRYSKRYSETQLNAIGGNQRNLLSYIYNLCKTNGSKVTPPLCREALCENTSIKKGTIKTAINRLITKHFLIVENSKTGRSGWIVFRIPDLIYQELFNNDISLSLNQTVLKEDSNGTQTVLKRYSERYSERYSTTPVVSSSYIDITTNNLPENFKQIDYSPLIGVGFDESHIIQIYREYLKKPEISLSAEIIQDSINAFAFDLKHNNIENNFRSSPVVVLISLLKKGQPYSSKTPEKVLTPCEEAMQEYFLAQEKKKQTFTEIEIKTKDCALQEWLNLLPEEELLNFNQDSRPNGMPEKLYQLSKRKKALEIAKEYFNTILWPPKLKQILNKAEN